MKRIEIIIEGDTPLICNRFTDEAQMAASSGSRVNTGGGDRGSPQEIATKKLYIGHDGKPMIPGPNLFRAIIDGGKFFKSGKSQITTLKSSLIPACVGIDEIEIPIWHDAPWNVDTRAVRIPSTGGRILAHRPSFNDWKLAFTILLDESLLHMKLLREIVDAAGVRIGLGDFRPACKGPYGKFKVAKWAEVSEQP
ncbi:MAG: hypothetical protein HQL97_01060 [Magnetococcales bacterium]|nr:hypothetical protein [Magnetococcales bacterium]